MKTQIAAIEFGTSKIVTVVAEGGASDRLNILGSGTVPYDGYDETNDWVKPSQMIRRVRDSITAAETQSGTRIRELYVGIPGQFIHTLSAEASVALPDGVVDDAAMAEVMDACADKLDLMHQPGMVIHRVPVWFKVDNGEQTLNPTGSGKKLSARITFMVAYNLFLEDVKEILGQLDITILGFLSTTLGESLWLIPINERDHTSVLIDVGYRVTEISAIQNDAVVYHAILFNGGLDFTEKLSSSLHIPMRDAEKIKRNYIFNADEFDRSAPTEITDRSGNTIIIEREDIQPIIEDTFDSLADMIELTIRNDVEPMLNELSQVFLTGGGLIPMRGAKERLTEKIGLAIRGCTMKSSRMNSPVFAGALGLCDLVFDSLEGNAMEQQGAISSIKSFFTGRK